MTNAVALLVFFALAIGMAGAVVALSAMIGRRELDEATRVPYECGLDPIGKPRHRFSVKFFLIATLFVIFDVEIVFLFPWAAVFRGLLIDGLGTTLLIELAIFVAILAAGLAYVWRVGALEWEQ